MKTKSSFKPLVLLLVVTVLATGLFFGYKHIKREAIRDYHNEQIAVGQIKLWMSEKEVFDTIGTRPEEEMCVYGYEFNFEALDINLGFRMDDHTLRRITVKNMTDSLYGIQNGMPIGTAEKILLAYGFNEDTQKNRYHIDDVYFTLGSKKGELVDFMIVEIIDDAILNYAQ